jgi:ligand-binding sensor domain-containing protein/signal transduction histidine kinase
MSNREFDLATMRLMGGDSQVCPFRAVIRVRARVYAAALWYSASEFIGNIYGAHTVRSIRTHVSRVRPTFCRFSLSLFALFFFGLASARGSSGPDIGGVPQARFNPDPVRINVIEGDDVRFLRLSGVEGLSQNRVTQIVQDDQGFMWLATQHGVDRYDGYQFRTFKSDPHQANSLCGVFMLSVFKDRSGTLWMGCEHGLDRFDPSTETFVHYPINPDTVPGLSDVVRHIHEDAGGILWLSTAHGLCRLDPRSRTTTWYHHSAGDRLSLSSDDIRSSGEDRHGVFWVASGEGLDAFDPNSSRVTFHVPLREPHELSFYEDRHGVFWILSASGNGLAVLDRQRGLVTRYLFAEDLPGLPLTGVIQMLEDRGGTIWVGTLSDGLLRFDRENSRFVRYRNDPSNPDSLPENRITTLLEDREGNIWVGLGATQPTFFTPRPPPFKGLPFDSGNRANLGEKLVDVIFQDHEGALWIGTTGALNRCDSTGRRCAHYAIPGHGVASDVLSLTEDGSGTLWVGTSGQGLCRFNKTSGSCQMFRHASGDPSSVSNDTISDLLTDREGILWIATADGLNRFEPATQRFTVYRDDTLPNPGTQMESMVEDQDGILWLGSLGSGVLRFDRKSQRLRGGVATLSNPIVPAVYIDRANNLWAGTFNGLDRLDFATGRTTRYAEENGLASSKISCILEDANGALWLSTNKGISKFDPKTGTAQNFSVADGLSGDLTGYNACWKSADGEMFFGGFAGAARFRPEDVANDSYVPSVALTEFDLFGASVSIAPGSPLKRVIGFTSELMLTHDQNSFSLQFSALSFRNPSTNRYRYKLDGLDQRWHEVGSGQRVASYTTLPAGAYRFRVQAATARGPWSAPGRSVDITIQPAWWSTWWFRGLIAMLLIAAGVALYLLRVRQISRQFLIRLEERVSERTRIARELHDSLLQGFQGLMFRLQAVRQLLPERPGDAAQFLDSAMLVGDEAIGEGRDAVQNLRSSTFEESDLATVLGALGAELAVGMEPQATPEYRVIVEGQPRELSPTVRDHIYRIAREAVRNAYQHANARHIETEITFGDTDLSVRVRDDGIGVDSTVLARGQRAGHWGLPVMRERSESIGGRLKVWSERNAGTEVELCISAVIAYTEPSTSTSSWIRRLFYPAGRSRTNAGPKRGAD